MYRRGRLSSPSAHRQKQSEFPGVIKILARRKNVITEGFFPFLALPVSSPSSPDATTEAYHDRRLQKGKRVCWNPISSRRSAAIFLSRHSRRPVCFDLPSSHGQKGKRKMLSAVRRRLQSHASHNSNPNRPISRTRRIIPGT